VVGSSHAVHFLQSTWLRALTSVARTSSVSCTGRTPSKKTAASDDLSLGTEFERIIAKIVQNYSKSSRSDVQDACSSIWKNPVLAFSKQGISRPLTTLCSEAMQTEAMKIAKVNSCFCCRKLFLTVFNDNISCHIYALLSLFFGEFKDLCVSCDKNGSLLKCNLSKCLAVLL